ncbi:MAG: AbrB/MazE/SpoVT family DNA-binding domain-containing protein [Thermoanaerobaculia bacterium]
MATAKVTSKGQVTIPKQVRRALQVEAGDRIDFVVEASDRVVMRKPGRSLLSLKGLLHRKGRKPVTLEDMDRAIARFHARENERVKNARR